MSRRRQRQALQRSRRGGRTSFTNHAFESGQSFRRQRREDGHDAAEFGDLKRLAGFDAIQLHAANGYLIDQFLRDSSNFCSDAYGGSVDNCIRLLVEVAAAVAHEIGASRTALRLSPNGMSQGVEDSAPNVLFPAAAAALSALGLAFLELREPREPGPDQRDKTTTSLIRQAFKGPLVLNASYNLETGAAALATGHADAITFGRTFLANPDLPQRFAKRLPLAADDIRTHYSQGVEGYTDYAVAGSQARGRSAKV